MNAKRDSCLSHPSKALALGLATILHFFFTNPCSHANTVYVSIPQAGTIMKFDPNGNGSVFANVSSGLNNPESLALDGSGNLYVANSGNINSIIKFDPNGNGS